MSLKDNLDLLIIISLIILNKPSDFQGNFVFKLTLNFIPLCLRISCSDLVRNLPLAV